MIYVCAHCDREMTDLRTEGDDLNHDLICAVCSQELDDLFQKAKEIQISLLHHFRRVL
ncbi:hypothetical protein ES702_06487 [subsurface metagenome]